MVCRAIFFSVTVLLLFCTSCMKEDYEQIVSVFSQIKEKPELSIVLIGDSTSGSDGSETGASYGTFLKQKMRAYLGKQVSVINSSRTDETFDRAKRHIPEDILSFRPDITLIMLGLSDSGENGLFLQFFRDMASGYFAQLQDAGVFAVVLTTTGFYDLSPGDKVFDRLKEFNDMIVLQARLNHFPVIDVSRHMEELREDNPKEYRAMFKDRIHLNDRGLEYVADFIFQTFRRTIEQSK